MPHSITAAERRQRDRQRLRALSVGAVYETRLVKARRQEVARVLKLARSYDDPEMVAPTISGYLNEGKYLGKWWQGLYIAAGIPAAQATAKSLRQAKASAEEDVWKRTLRDYAARRAGANITLVTGTLKETLVNIVRELLQEELTIGVEALTSAVYKRYKGQFERWMARRIAQTETMIGMAEAGQAAADTLDVKYTKQWCISGLGNTRETHEVMDGIEVEQDEPFVLDGGVQMMYPHDLSFDPPASEIINCACDCIRRAK